MKKNEMGFFQAAGREVDCSLYKLKKRISSVVDLAEDENDELKSDVDSDEAIKSIKKLLMSRLEDIACPAGDDFAYSTILKWVRENATGNQLCMVKHHNNKNNKDYLFLFFMSDEEVFVNEDSPLICYIMQKIPMGIFDMFNDKDILIQKIVK